MQTLASLLAAGDPVDPDLVSLLEAEGYDTVESVHSIGRAHWIAFLADPDGFTRDLVEYPEMCGLTWEQAAEAERFQGSLDDVEIGVSTMMVAERLGATSFADVFRRSPDDIRLAMAERTGLLTELDQLIARAGLAW